MKNKTKGFTLIELLVVIAIIGLLSALATVAARYAIDKAKIAKAQHATDTIYNAINMLGNDTSEWPGHQTPNQVNTTGHVDICGPDATLPLPALDCGVQTIDSGFAGIIENDGTTPYSNWGGPYMSNIALDPWGHQYFFDTNYNVSPDNVACGCDSNPILSCRNVVAVGSYGPDGLGATKVTTDDSTSDQACDDVLKIIAF
jgi:prepilin-type N-terminal cleavage/methylation domain-containing protein